MPDKTFDDEHITTRRANVDKLIAEWHEIDVYPPPGCLCHFYDSWDGASKFVMPQECINCISYSYNMQTTTDLLNEACNEINDFDRVVQATSALHRVLLPELVRKIVDMARVAPRTFYIA